MDVSFGRKGFNAGNISSPALRMLMEKKGVSKREGPIFASDVADLPCGFTAHVALAHGVLRLALERNCRSVFSWRCFLFFIVKYGIAAVPQNFSI